MTMDKEQRKLYNQKYYSNKKDEILSKHKEKIVCPLCFRNVRNQNLQLHQKTFICSRIYNKQNNLNKVNLLEEQVKKLTEMIENKI